MIYEILKVIARFIFLSFYRKVQYSGIENIPEDKPVLIACNHPAGFQEPCIFSTLLPFQLHFLVRGDLFKKSRMNWFLTSTNQIPIFRFKDGFSNLRNNQESFKEAITRLKDNKKIMIFAEGSTEDVRELRKLKKGLARLAFAAMEEYPDMDLKVIPMGMNFTDPGQLRSHLTCRVGKPISVKTYYSEFRSHPQKFNRKLTSKVEEEMKNHILHLDKEEDRSLLEALIHDDRISNPISRFPVFEKSDEMLKRELEIIDKVNGFSSNEKTDVHYSWRQSGERAVYFSRNSDFVELILLVLGAIPAVLGFILNIVPYVIVKSFVEKKVPKRIYKLGVMAAVCAVVFPLYYIIVILVACFILGKWTLLVFLVPLLGYYFISYKDRMIQYLHPTAPILSSNSQNDIQYL